MNGKQRNEEQGLPRPRSWPILLFRGVFFGTVALMVLGWGWWLIWGRGYERAWYFRQKAGAVLSSEKYFQELKERGEIPVALRNQEEAAFYFQLRSLDEKGRLIQRRLTYYSLAGYFLRKGDKATARECYRLFCPEPPCVPEADRLFFEDNAESNSGGSGQ